jgi:thymidylate synthase (FAD)
MNEDETGNIRDYNKVGITRDLARINLTLNQYTEWYWKIDLHNLLHFVALRADQHAQYEIRAYAEKMLDIIKQWVPYTFEAFEEHVLNSTKLSKTATKVIASLIAGEKVTRETSGLSSREWEEVTKSFNLKIT